MTTSRALKTAIDKYNNEFKANVKIDEVFKELENSQEHWALLEGSLWIIHRNLVLLNNEKEFGIYSGKNNIYTKLRLFDGIISLCRFFELRMKSYENVTGTLGHLLFVIFNNESWYKNEVQDKIIRDPTPTDFDQLLQDTRARTCFNIVTCVVNKNIW